jgi:nicotinamide-nucleotide amidase
VTGDARSTAAAGSHQSADQTAVEVRQRLARYVFGESDETLPGVVIRILEERRETLAVAESCTGGMLGELITRVPGASAAFLGGLITYSNELKELLLGVDPALLAEHGAVSEQVAAAMAAGCLVRTRAHHSLAITGIAGPGGSTPKKPVGTVYICRASRKNAPETVETDTRRFLISGDRDDIRSRAATTALTMLFMSLGGDAPGPLLWQV